MGELGVGSGVGGGKASNQQSVDRNEDSTTTNAAISYKSLVITH